MAVAPRSGRGDGLRRASSSEEDVDSPFFRRAPAAGGTRRVATRRSMGDFMDTSNLQVCRGFAKTGVCPNPSNCIYYHPINDTMLEEMRAGGIPAVWSSTDEGAPGWHATTPVYGFDASFYHVFAMDQASLSGQLSDSTGADGFVVGGGFPIPLASSGIPEVSEDIYVPVSEFPIPDQLHGFDNQPDPFVAPNVATSPVPIPQSSHAPLVSSLPSSWISPVPYSPQPIVQLPPDQQDRLLPGNVAALVHNPPMPPYALILSPISSPKRSPGSCSASQSPVTSLSDQVPDGEIFEVDACELPGSTDPRVSGRLFQGYTHPDSGAQEQIDKGSLMRGSDGRPIHGGTKAPVGKRRNQANDRGYRESVASHSRTHGHGKVSGERDAWPKRRVDDSWAGRARRQVPNAGSGPGASSSSKRASTSTTTSSRSIVEDLQKLGFPLSTPPRSKAVGSDRVRRYSEPPAFASQSVHGTGHSWVPKRARGRGTMHDGRGSNGVGRATGSSGKGKMSGRGATKDRESFTKT